MTQSPRSHATRFKPGQPQTPKGAYAAKLTWIAARLKTLSRDEIDRIRIDPMTSELDPFARDELFDLLWNIERHVALATQLAASLSSFNRQKKFKSSPEKQ